MYTLQGRYRCNIIVSGGGATSHQLAWALRLSPLPAQGWARGLQLDEGEGAGLPAKSGGGRSWAVGVGTFITLFRRQKGPEFGRPAFIGSVMRAGEERLKFHASTALSLTSNVEFAPGKTFYSPEGGGRRTEMSLHLCVPASTFAK